VGVQKVMISFEQNSHIEDMNVAQFDILHGYIFVHSSY
jgi:hypothetical protein